MIRLSFRLRLLLSFSLLLSLSLSLYSQSCQDASVELWVEIETNRPKIILHWVPNANATAHFVYRKLKTSSSWGAVVGNLPGSATAYIDSTVNVGTNYEYRVIRQADAFSGYGYINAGIEVPAVDSRGIILLVIDQTFVSLLRNEIKQWIEDVQGDGWRIAQLWVDRNASPSTVKSLIKDSYDYYGSRIKAAFLLGHVPVPYSGELAPDGHPDHIGAWPADVYYADMNGTWTDNLVNNINATDERNDNKPKDGKFDQSVLPSDVELQIGRVDFANMPSFAASEEELLRNYLNKNHAFRHKLFSAIPRAVIDDNFGYFNGEAFASTGYKNIGPIVGPANVIANDYFTTLADSSYLWSYGCGGGWYQGAGGVGSTGDFANSHTQSVFTMLFGSYFGDWDSQDNFLRAPLAQGLTLTNAWSGRPHWMFHHMGLGENIGYSAKLTQNNSATYFASYGGRFVTIALMGDPTLRNDMVSPPSNLVASDNGYHVSLSWDPSTDDILGYNVYRFSNIDEDLIKINSEPLTTNEFIDSCVTVRDSLLYMVWALKLQRSPSGSYYNQSQGSFARLYHASSPVLHADGNFVIEGSTVDFWNLSTGDVDHVLWLFGDGDQSTEDSVNHEYIPGNYLASLIVWNECQADTLYFNISILTSTLPVSGDGILSVLPNPSSGTFHIRMEDQSQILDVAVFSTAGIQVFQKDINATEAIIDLGLMPSGMYNLRVNTLAGIYLKRIVLKT